MPTFTLHNAVFTDSVLRVLYYTNQTSRGDRARGAFEQAKAFGWRTSQMNTASNSEVRAHLAAMGKGARGRHPHLGHPRAPSCPVRHRATRLRWVGLGVSANPALRALASSSPNSPPLLTNSHKSKAPPRTGPVQLSKPCRL